MDSLAYIKNKIKTTLEKNNVVGTEIDAIAEELMPSVLQVLVHDHADTLKATQTTIATLPDAEIFEHPKIKLILEASIEKVCDMYKNEYTNISIKGIADTIISNDIATLLKTSPLAWGTLQDKTYQEITTVMTPGSNDERVFLWVGEIKKGTGVAPTINETVGEYSKRAISSFLKSKPEIRV